MERAPKPSLDFTIMVIAYNEVVGLRQTVEECVAWIRHAGTPCPILIMDDGSTDGTGPIADELAREYPFVRVHHHPRNVGHFNNITEGLKLIETKYFTIVPADGEVVVASLDLFVPHIGQYDIIFGFPNNEWVRGRKRVMLSHLWRLYLLALFGVGNTYLAGLTIAPTELLRSLSTSSNGFLGWYEAMVRLVLSGTTFIQIPFEIRERQGGDTKALNPLKNVRDLVRMARIWARIKGPGILPQGPDFESLRAFYSSYRNALESRAPRSINAPVRK